MNADVMPLKLEILNETYTVVSDEPEDRVLEASMMVDDLMRQFATKVPHMDVRKMAILTALQFASKLVAAQEVLADKNRKELAVEAQISRIMEINTDF